MRQVQRQVGEAEPLVKAPTLIGWYQAVGKPRPIRRARRERRHRHQQTGKFTAGMIERMAVAKTAVYLGPG